MLRLFSSLRTTIGLSLALVALAIWGSLEIQFRPGSYATIEDTILLPWLRARVGEDPRAASWVLAMMGVSALLCLNTAVCVVRRLAAHARSGRWPVRAVAAHLAHLGFLVVLAAHLHGSVSGFRSDGHQAFGGQSFSVTDRPEWRFDVGELTLELAPQGYPTLLRAQVTARQGEAVLAQGAVEVNRPLLVQGVAVYVKAVQPSVRGWGVLLPDGRAVTAEVGSPLPLPGGTLLVREWTQMGGRAIALRVEWRPASGGSRQEWVVPSPGSPLPIGPGLRWGEIVVDSLAIFDVRCDPGATMALVGSALLSLSLVPLVIRRTPGGRLAAGPGPVEVHESP